MYENIFYAGLLLFLTGLIVTAILFRKNNVAAIIGDLTGLHAKRAMRDLPRKSTVKKDGTVSGVPGLFGIEEDITVLGGEMVSEMPATVILDFENMDFRDHYHT